MRGLVPPVTRVIRAYQLPPPPPPKPPPLRLKPLELLPAPKRIPPKPLPLGRGRDVSVEPMEYMLRPSPETRERESKRPGIDPLTEDERYHEGGSVKSPAKRPAHSSAHPRTTA